MFSFLTFVCRLIFNLGMSKKDLLLQVSLQEKEIEILKRKHRGGRLRFRLSDRVVFAILNKAGHLKERFTVVKPETVLGWQRQLILIIDLLNWSHVLSSGYRCKRETDQKGRPISLVDRRIRKRCATISEAALWHPDGDCQLGI
jgi:hypothetical protein